MTTARKWLFASNYNDVLVNYRRNWLMMVSQKNIQPVTWWIRKIIYQKTSWQRRKVGENHSRDFGSALIYGV